MASSADRDRERALRCELAAIPRQFNIRLRELLFLQLQEVRDRLETETSEIECRRLQGEARRLRDLLKPLTGPPEPAGA